MGTVGTQTRQGTGEPRQGELAEDKVIWQDLRLVIIDALRNHGKMVYSKEEHHLKQELALVTNMSLIMEQRLKLLQLFAMRVEFGSEY